MKENNPITPSGQDLFKRYLHPGLLENPPADFTQKIMNQINQEAPKTSVTSSPVVSPLGWLIVIFTVIILYTIPFLYYQQESSTGTFYLWNLSVWFARIFQEFETNNLSYLAFLVSAATLLIMLADSFFRMKRIRFN
jgi:hypothetical protein